MAVLRDLASPKADSLEWLSYKISTILKFSGRNVP